MADRYETRDGSYVGYPMLDTPDPNYIGYVVSAITHPSKYLLIYHNRSLGAGFLNIYVGPVKFYVDKALLCHRAPKLAEAVSTKNADYYASTDFGKGKFATWKLFLHWLYTGELLVMENVADHILLYQFADRWDVNELRHETYATIERFDFSELRSRKVKHRWTVANTVDFRKLFATFVGEDRGSDMDESWMWEITKTEPQLAMNLAKTMALQLKEEEEDETPSNQ